jgi:hypothetical protein
MTGIFQTRLQFDVPLENVAIKEIVLVCHNRYGMPVNFGLKQPRS